MCPNTLQEKIEKFEMSQMTGAIANGSLRLRGSGYDEEDPGKTKKRSIFEITPIGDAGIAGGLPPQAAAMPDILEEEHLGLNIIRFTVHLYTTVCISVPYVDMKDYRMSKFVNEFVPGLPWGSGAWNFGGVQNPAMNSHSRIPDLTRM